MSAKPKSLRLATLDGRAVMRPGPAKRPSLAAAAVPARQQRALAEAYAEAQQILAIIQRAEAVAEAMLRASVGGEAITIQALARENTIQAPYAACRVRNLIEVIECHTGGAP